MGIRQNDVIDCHRRAEYEKSRDEYKGLLEKKLGAADEEQEEEVSGDEDVGDGMVITVKFKDLEGISVKVKEV